MAIHLGKQCINRALKHNVRSYADTVLKSGVQILVWRDKIVNNRIFELLGTCTVKNFDVEKKLVYVRDDKKNSVKHHNFTQCKLYLPPDKIARPFMVNLQAHLGQLSEEHDVSPLSQSEETLLAKIIKKSDPRSKSPEMDAAINRKYVAY